MKQSKSKSPKVIIMSVSIIVSLMFLGICFGAVKLFLSDDGSKRKRQISMVTLVKPPPPKIKEKLPEPEIKKEEIVEVQPEEIEPETMDNDMAEDDIPPGDDLGLDADGVSGLDNFGLRAKKGGRSLIGGRFSEAAMLRRYGWYTRILQEELRKKVNRYIEQNGGVPDGELLTFVKVCLDEEGNIVDFSISKASGNDKMDMAVQEVLIMAKVSEPPPEGMPRVLNLKISSRG